jgi:hypothetical protein
MVEEPSQRRELLAAASVWAMIELRGVTRRIEMLIQALERLKRIVAKVALVAIAIPRAHCGRIGGVAVPFEQLVGECAVGITATKCSVDSVPIKPRLL